MHATVNKANDTASAGYRDADSTNTRGAMGPIDPTK